MLILIIIIGIILIAINVRAIRREEKSFNKVLNLAEDNTDEVDIKIGELRREFAESLLDLQQEIEEIKKLYEIKEIINTQVQKNKDDNIIIEKNESYSSDNIDIINKGENNRVKVQEIEKLLSENKSIDQIAEILGIGKGEVLLIKELYLK